MGVLLLGLWIAGLTPQCELMAEIPRRGDVKCTEAPFALVLEFDGASRQLKVLLRNQSPRREIFCKHYYFDPVNLVFSGEGKATKVEPPITPPAALPTCEWIEPGAVQEIVSGMVEATESGDSTIWWEWFRYDLTAGKYSVRAEWRCPGTHASGMPLPPGTVGWSGLLVSNEIIL